MSCPQNPPIPYSTILTRSREVSALITNRKYRAAWRAADTLRECLATFIDAQYVNVPDSLLGSADPTAVCANFIAVAEAAHPMSAAYVLENLCTLLDRIAGDLQEARETITRVDVSDIDVEAER